MSVALFKSYQIQAGKIATGAQVLPRLINSSKKFRNFISVNNFCQDPAADGENSPSSATLDSSLWGRMIEAELKSRSFA